MNRPSKRSIDHALRYLYAIICFLLFVIILLILSQTNLRKHDWLEAWGTWFGGLGSFAAVIAALYISVNDQRKRKKDKDNIERAQLIQISYYLHGPLEHVKSRVEELFAGKMLPSLGSPLEGKMFLIDHDFSIKHLMSLPNLDRDLLVSIFALNYHLDRYNKDMPSKIILKKDMEMLEEKWSKIKTEMDRALAIVDQATKLPRVVSTSPP